MHSSQFFRILDNVHIPGRWMLGDILGQSGEVIDGRAFTRGVPVGRTVPLWTGGSIELVPPLIVSVSDHGRPVDFTFAAFELPIVTAELGAAIVAAAPRDVQCVPARVAESSVEYEILNVAAALPCLDEGQSVYLWWTEADGRPEKVGTYRGVQPVMILPDKTRGRDVFRIEGWEVAMIVSERIKDLCDSMEVTGIKFEPVTS